MKMPFSTRLCFLAILLCWACQTPQQIRQHPSPAKLLRQYAVVPLEPDISHLNPRQKRLVPLLIQAAQLMDDIFWREAYGSPDSLFLESDDPALRELLEINYGPWNRLDDNQPIFPFVTPKPAGANFYPEDVNRSEVEQQSPEDLSHPYQLIRKDSSGRLVSIPYHQYFRSYHQQAASLLKQAASITENQAFARYLMLSGRALTNDQYSASQYLWLDLQEQPIDFLIGPIETYEDKLYGFKAAHQSLVMVRQPSQQDALEILTNRDEITERLMDQFPLLQNSSHLPGSVEWYDLLYAAGLFNAGPKSVGINLPTYPGEFPNRGSRRILFRNLINAKFERILQPLSESFFPNTFQQGPDLAVYHQLVLCHEMAHSLGIWTVRNGNHSVLDALRQYASAVEEAKASLLGFLILLESRKIHPRLDNQQIKATYFASLLRAVRFGNSSAHGQASRMILSYMRQQGLWDWRKGQLQLEAYADWEKIISNCLQQLLHIQENGMAEKAASWLENSQDMFPSDLSEALLDSDIPVDLRFEQGLHQFSEFQD